MGREETRPLHLLCYRTQDSAITRVLAASPSGWSVLALPSNTLLPSRHPAPHQHPPHLLLCTYNINNALKL